MKGHLSTAQVARITRMSESRVRELVRSGLCRPTREGRRYAFSFQDVVVLRTAQALFEQDVPPARVQRALAALAEDLDGRPLSGARIFADGRQVAVRDERGAWNPETGQALLAFGVDALADMVDAVRREEKPHDSEATHRAAKEFERALSLEDEDPSAARAAYEHALELDPELVDAYVNLGRILHEQGEAIHAVELYRRALFRLSNDPVLHFNLALALEDAEGGEAAATHYERAVQLDPAFADAHYNLAGLCERLGRNADALRHYSAYKRLTQT